MVMGQEKGKFTYSVYPCNASIAVVSHAYKMLLTVISRHIHNIYVTSEHEVYGI